MNVFTLLCKRTAPEELKIYCNFSSGQYKNLRAFFNQNANILGVDKTIKLWRSRRWPVQATLLLKDGIVLLEHEACQEQWIFSTTSRRGTLPISVGMTDLVASQLYNLSDIVKANSAIRHLHRHSEAARGWSWQCIAMSRGSRDPKPRPNLRKKYSDQIWSFWMWSAVKVS